MCGKKKGRRTEGKMMREKTSNGGKKDGKERREGKMTGERRIYV